MPHTEFYVTKGASVSDVNGGGPSLAANDAPVTALVGGGGAGATSDAPGTGITDLSGGNWAGSSVDDFLCFDTAGAKEFARITNIAVAVATVTPAVTGNQADKSCNVGGAWATVDHAASTITTSFVNGSGYPPRVNIQFDAVAYTESVTNDHDGTVAIPLTFEGYETAAGDRSANRPTITDAAAATTWIGNDKDYIILRNLIIAQTGANNEALYVGANGQLWWIEDCEFSDTGGDGYCVLLDWMQTMVNCKVTANTHGVFLALDCAMFGCFISAGSNGVWAEDRTAIVGCIFDSCGDDGVYLIDGNLFISHCVMYGSTGGSGIRMIDLTPFSQPIVRNNIFMSNNQYGIEVDAAQAYLWQEDYNAFYNNGVNEVLNVGMQSGAGAHTGSNSVTLTGDPFTNAAGDDFSLDAVAGQGAACRDAGFPGVMLDGGTGHIDIGALQHDDPAGGGAIRSPVGLTGGLS